MMEVLGFLFLLFVGGYFLVAGIAGTYASYAFSGKSMPVATVFFIIGCAVLYLAFGNMPFTIIFTGN